MTPKIIIELTKVNLKFTAGVSNARSIKNELINIAITGKRRSNKSEASIHALKDISCRIIEGERIGLIGHNGAGKSTFLRLLSGIYEHTSGQVNRHVEIHPMIRKTFLTGVESSGWDAAKASYLLEYNNLRGFNSYMEDISEFTQLGKHLFLPMKTYSEGMKARLMFAILTSSKHKCLAVDEGFGAGDRRFFERASKRLSRFLRSSGTVIMASHSEKLLKQFCSRGIVFKEGAITFDGELGDAFQFYNGKNY